MMSSQISSHRQGSAPRWSANFAVSSPEDAGESLRPEHPFSPTQMEADSLMELTATSLQVSAQGHVVGVVMSNSMAKLHIRMDGWLGGWMDGCMHGWMDGWMDGMDEGTNP